MNDLELEELEAHLYSQVYHSNEDIGQNLSTLSFENLQTSVDTMRKPNRYFQKSPRWNGAKFQNKQNIATQQDQKSPAYNNDDQTQGIYSKSCTRPHKRDISINQLVVISPQQAPIVCVTKSNPNKQKKRWRVRHRERKRRQKIAELLNSKEHVECEVITLSDSDGESCVEVSNHWPVVSVADSDDETKKGEKVEETFDTTSANDLNLSTQSVDDVIFVEPVNAPIEIINIDEDVDNILKNPEDVNTHVDLETASVTSSNNSFISNYVQSKSGNLHPHQERKELLNTPDSASNDFIQNLELNQDNFNFSLHGRDFNNDKFVKPSNPTETCETESSTSTTELNALNTMKTVVFNEIEFPKDDMFADANLESFGNFITPLRQSKDKQTIQSTPGRKALYLQDENVYASSDSSSESDYDDKQKETLKSKHLPDLSPMHSDNERTSKKEAKKTRKAANVSSKYDLINPTVSEIVVKKSKQKKRKSLPLILEALNNSKKKSKNKKRKTDSFIDNDQTSQIMTESAEKNPTACSVSNESGVEANLTITSQNNVDAVDGEAKQKKRKSSQFLDESSENLGNSQVKKRRSKKKKNNTEAESDENVTVVETSVISQQFDEKPIKDHSSNVESTHHTDAPSDNVVVISDQVVELEQPSKKRRSKKKKNNTETESDENVIDLETSVISQQVDETPIKDQSVNVEGTNHIDAPSDNVVVISDHMVELEQPSKKRRSKKKKNNTETESDENVTDLETSVISQQVDETPIKVQSSNVESTNHTDAPSDNVVVISDHMVELEQPSKRRRSKKKKNNTEAESDENVTVVESSVISQQLDENPIKDQSSNVGSTIHIDAPSDNVVVISDHVVELEQPSKKRRSKKKKNNTETESDENVTDLETSVISQQIDENPIKDQSSNVESTNHTDAPSDNVVTSDHVVEQEQPSLVLEEANISLKMAQDGLDVTEPTMTAVQEVPQLNIETGPKSPNMLETSADDVILIEQPPNPEIVLSSDSESNLSPLQDKYDIQLINCGEAPEPPPPPNIITSEGPSRPVLDLSNSTLEEVQHTMSNDPKLWTILDSDRIPVREDTRGRRCNKCRERGHMAIRCPNKVTPKCHLCGEPGHYEPRCPNRICTQCGERSPYSTTYCKFCFKFRTHQCEICFMVGHGANNCPDLWRRYHLTTSEGPLTTYNGPLLKPKHKLWCSGCARSGHLEYTCRYFQSLYPPADPHIKSYEDVYQGRRAEQTQGVRPSLFYNTLQPNPIAQLVFPNSYQSNNLVMNPFVNNALGPMFQQNAPVFFNNGGANMYPTNQINLVHNQQRPNNNFSFEDNLPNFISFESSVPSTSTNYQVVEERPYYNRNENVPPATSTAVNNNNDRRPPRHTTIFYSSPPENIQRFIRSELYCLAQLSHRLIDIVKNLRKQRPQYSENHKRNRYYRTLNMVLFGIYKLLEGEKHLVKLKTFKVMNLKAKLSHERRHDLYRSYSYIFGFTRHDGVDYNELLRRL